MFVVLKPKNEREPLPGRDRQAARATAGVPGIQTFFASDPEHQYRWPNFEERNINTRCRAATPRRSTGSRPNCATSSPRLPELRDVNTDLYIRNPQMFVDIDREKAAVYGITVDQIRQELYNAYRLASGRDHLHAVERLSGHPGNAAEIPGRPGLSVEAPDQDRERPDSSRSMSVAKLVPTVGPLLVNHQGQQPSVTISFNIAPGVFDRSGNDGDRARRTRIESAGDDRDRLPGHRAGVPGRAEGAGPADPCCDLRGLCDPRHPV